jgi:hypothetical protein
MLNLLGPGQLGDFGDLLRCKALVALFEDLIEYGLLLLELLCGDLVL